MSPPVRLLKTVRLLETLEYVVTYALNSLLIKNRPLCSSRLGLDAVIGSLKGVKSFQRETVTRILGFESISLKP